MLNSLEFELNVRYSNAKVVITNTGVILEVLLGDLLVDI